MLLLLLSLCTAQLTLHNGKSELRSLHAYEEQYSCHADSGEFVVVQLDFVVCNNGTERHFGIPEVVVELSGTTGILATDTLSLPYLRDQHCSGRPRVYTMASESISPGCCVRVFNTPCFWLPFDTAWLAEDLTLQLQMETSLLDSEIESKIHAQVFTPVPMILLLSSVFVILTIPYFMGCPYAHHSVD